MTLNYKVESDEYFKILKKGVFNIDCHKAEPELGDYDMS